ncbi:hypothetical protein FRC07_001266, partial [Ceratobasidium sp. 392]
MSQAGFQLAEPSQKLVRAIGSLLHDGIISAAVLEDILDLGELPHNMRLLRNPELVPTCMKILRQHCAHTPEAGSIERYISLAATGHDPNINVVEFLSFTLQEKLYKDNKDPNNIGALPGPFYVDTVLSADHVDQLLEYLYDERDLFLQARISKPDQLNGWSALFYAMLGKLPAGGKLRAKQLKRFRDLTHRLAVVKPPIALEEELFDYMTLHLTAVLLGDDQHIPPVTRSDGHQIVQAYISRLSSHNPSLKFSRSLFDWGASGLDTSRMELVASFFKTSLDRMWTMMEELIAPKHITYLDLHDC